MIDFVSDYIFIVCQTEAQIWVYDEPVLQQMMMVRWWSMTILPRFTLFMNRI